MFIDELAAMTGRDPVAFRLADVGGPRPEAVLKRAVEMSGWTPRAVGRWDAGIMRAVDYGSYPIQDFVTHPAISSVVIDRPEQPSLGAGEGSQAPVGAAIANAIFAATGRRVAEIPFTPQRVLASLAT